VPSPDERSIVLRRFDGTNILVDSAYLGPTYLRASQNWVPGDTFRLTKRPGSLAYAAGAKTSCLAVLKMIRVYDSAAEPDALVAQLAEDEAIAEADTLLLTVPNQLGVDYNAHLLENILTHVAPALGWR